MITVKSVPGAAIAEPPWLTVCEGLAIEAPRRNPVRRVRPVSNFNARYGELPGPYDRSHGMHPLPKSLL